MGFCHQEILPKNKNQRQKLLDEGAIDFDRYSDRLKALESCGGDGCRPPSAVNPTRKPSKVPTRGKPTKEPTAKPRPNNKSLPDGGVGIPSINIGDTEVGNGGPTLKPRARSNVGTGDTDVGTPTQTRAPVPKKNLPLNCVKYSNWKFE